MTINFTTARKGVRYNLGHIHQSIVNGRLMYIIIPSFEARPPLAFTKLKGAENRFNALCDSALEKGIKLPKDGEKIHTGVEIYTF